MSNMWFGLISQVELAGIEPASENSSIILSPITVYIHLFPPKCAYRQAHLIGSFINFPKPQSLSRGVSHDFDASALSCGAPRTDSCH